MSTYIQAFIHAVTATIRPSEVGPERGATPFALYNLLQDAADNHARILGIGVADLAVRNLAWMYAAATLCIARVPKMQETLRVETWPTFANKLYAFRRFRVLDQAGDLVFTGAASWIVYDFAAKALAKIPEDIRAIKPPAAADLSPACGDKIPALGEPATEIAFRVRRGDLDFNRHVNSAAYCQWAAETTPEHIQDTYSLSFLDIRFRAECLFGDTVSSQSREIEAPGPRQFLHKLVRLSDGKETARAVTTWTPR